MASIGLQGLTTELLVKIFRYLSIPDLCRLRKTCKRFQLIVDTWDHSFLKRHGITLVTNQVDERFLHNRCLQKLTKIEKLRIQGNWILGRYQEHGLLFTKQKFIPWLHVNSDTVWLSRGNRIFCYSRSKRSILSEKPQYILSEKNRSDLTKFQIKNDHLVSGRRDGSIILWSLKTKRPLFDEQLCHTSEINSVDISSNTDLIVSGSRDDFFKVWSVRHGNQTKLEEYYTVDLRERVWAVTLCEENRHVAVGTAGVRTPNKSLMVYDIEKFSDRQDFSVGKPGSGILDIKWDRNTLWTCEYDSYVRHWDMRSGKCEQILEDPFVSSLYCLDLDYHNTVMAGTQRHGRVAMWDTRMTKCVQFYFMESCKRNRSSPVYGLAFDSEHLFTATDQNLNVLNFNVHNQPTHDFSHFTKKFIH